MDFCLPQCKKKYISLQCTNLNTFKMVFTKREKRLDALRVILSNRTSATQREILQELAVAGFHVSQPTLAGDLQHLHAGKVKTRKGYQYILPRESQYSRPVDQTILPDYMQHANCKSVTFSGQTMVLKTRPGYAQGLAADIDAAELPTVAGTVAGYDTVFVAAADGTTRGDLVSDLTSVIPALAGIL